MRIWLDILSPKQLLLHTSLAKAFIENGHDVLLTSRYYVQLDGLIESMFRDWEIIRVGAWGGETLEGKLKASIERARLLLDIILKNRPDLALSSGSIEAARICYGLRIPHILISDTPHSPVNKLVAPVSEKILTPWIISKDEWIKAGAHEKKIRYYRALDPCFWLKDFKPRRDVLDDLNLVEREYILLRPPETKASYLRIDEEGFLEAVKALASHFKEIKLVILCRYKEQAERSRKIAEENVVVVDKLLPGPSIIYYSLLFVGGGGTMTQEASLLGIPSITIYPKDLPSALNFLVERGLLIRCNNFDNLIHEAEEILREWDQFRERWDRAADSLWREMEDPIKTVLDEVSSLVSS